MRYIAGTFLLIIPAIFPVGCHAPAIPSGPTVAVFQISDREQFLDDTATLLRERGFKLERLEPESGALVTRPSTSQQWFEFWRRDAIGGYQLFESSMHTIRRIVTISLAAPSESGESAGTGVTVHVEKQRFSTPERQVTTASGALSIFSRRLPTAAGVRGTRASSPHWVSLGRDPLLEADLLEHMAPLAGEEYVPAESSGSVSTVDVSEPPSDSQPPSPAPAKPTPKPAPHPQQAPSGVTIETVD